MRFAIIGAGGIGGQLAVRLARAGHPVHVIARGAHLAAVEAGHLTLRTPDETLSAEVAASETAAGADPVDTVVFAVKGQDLEGAMETAAPLMGPGTLALPLLNGVEATDRLAARFGPERALIGIAEVGAHIEAPGLVVQTTPMARFTFGQAPRAAPIAAVQEIRRLWAEAGIQVGDAADLPSYLWRKFVFLTPFSAVTAGARCTAADIVATPALSALFATLAEEVVALARAEGIALPEGLIAERLGFLGKLGPGVRSSMSHDLEAGKPLEIDWLSGAVPRLAAPHGLSAPANATVAALLEPFKAGRR